MADTFQNLEVFKEAHKLVLEVYSVTKKFPSSEQFGLTSQIRRSSVSVVANIVEGNSRGHSKEYVQFLYLSKGSLEESKYHLLLAKDLQYISVSEYEKLHHRTESVGMLVSGLIKYWKSKSFKS